MLLVLFVRRGERAPPRDRRWPWSWWLVVCFDRMLLGRHYPTDVIGGSLLALGVFLLALALIDPRPRSTAAKAEPLPEVYASERRLAVILNPIKVEDVGQFRAIVGAMAKESGWSEPTWQYTTVEDPGTGMAEKAAVSGADLVIVCGGDGTVREVCAELAGTGIPVGIIPAGTGNLLARNLDVPLYLRSAIDVALNGQDRAIDLVRVGGDGIEDTHFMVMAGMGFDAAIMEGVNEEIKKKIGWIAYVVSGLRSLMFPAIKVEIQIDDEEPTDPPGPHRRRRQRRLPPGRDAAAARRHDRRRHPRRRDHPPAPVPVVDHRGARGCCARARSSTRRSTAAPARASGSRPRRRHPPPARRRLDRRGPRALDGVHPRPAAGPRPPLIGRRPACNAGCDSTGCSTAGSAATRRYSAGQARKR